MPFNDAQNQSFRLKAQSALGSPASGGSGVELPVVASPSFRLTKAPIPDPAIGSDGMKAVTRHGSRAVSGSVSTVVRLGATDIPILAALRSAAWTSAAQVTQATMTSITTTANTIVAAAGSWITQGVRVGQVVYLTNHSTAGNNSIPLLVTAVTANTITVVGLAAGSATPLTLNAVADTTFELNIAKYAGQGTAKTYFTMEQYFADVDRSITTTDAMVTSMELTLAPNAAAQLTFGITGINAASNNAGAAPVLTSPTTYETANMVSTDAVILKNGVVVTNITGLSFTLDLSGATLETVGSAVSPDVFVENAVVRGSLTVPMEDETWFEHFNDEDELSLAVCLKEPETGLFDHLTFYLPVVKLTAAPDWSLGGSGPLTGQVSFEAGRKPTTSGFVETMLLVSTSAA